MISMFHKDLFLPHNTYIIVPAIKVCCLDCEFEKLLISEVDDDFRIKLLKERKHLLGIPPPHAHTPVPKQLQFKMPFGSLALCH